MTSATRLVRWLGACEPPAQLMGHLKSRGLVLQTEGVSGPVPPARLSMLRATGSPPERLSLAGRRVAVLHPDPGAADSLAQSLRQRGATVVVLSLDPEALDRIETFDPDAVLVEPADFIGGCWEIARAVWSHHRLRWTPVLLTPAEPLGLGSVSAPDGDRVCQEIGELSASYDTLRKRAESAAPFEVSLDTLGPARTLRALIASGATLRVRFECLHAIEVDIAEHIIAGAREVDANVPADALLGPGALGHVLAMDQAKVSVRRVTSPAVTNIMAPLDDALHAARKFSMPPPPPTSAAPYVARRELSAPSNDVVPAAPSVKPGARSNPGVRTTGAQGPPSGRVYAVASAIPPPPTPVQALVSPPSRTLPLPQLRAAVDRGRQVSSAAALNIDAELGPRFVSPAPESGPQILKSEVVELAPRGLPDAWAPAELNGLLSDHFDTHSAVLADAPPNAAGKRNWLDWAQARLGPAKAWLPEAREYVRKPRVRTALLSALMVLVISVLLRSDGPVPTSRASANTAVLKIRVTKVTPEPPPVVEVEDASDEQEERGATRTAATKRASALVSEGHAFRRDNKLPKAEDLYRQALRESPGYPRALVGLSRTAIQRGDGATALRYARMLVRVRPRQAASHLLLGDAHLAAKNLVAARSAWKVAAKRGDGVAKGRLH